MDILDLMGINPASLFNFGTNYETIIVRCTFSSGISTVYDIDVLTQLAEFSNYKLMFEILSVLLKIAKIYTCFFFTLFPKTSLQGGFKRPYFLQNLC